MPTIYGTPTNDQLTGGAGDDLIFGYDGNDSLDGGLGADYLDGGDGVDNLDGSDGFAVYDGVDDGAVDTLVGGAGDDYVAIQFRDNADGGDGVDTLLVGFQSFTSGVTVDLSVNANLAVAAAMGGSYITGFEQFELYGTRFNDSFVGTAERDTLYGGEGADVLTGGAGNDILYANDQIRRIGDTLFIVSEANDGVADILSGGDGNDSCYVSYLDSADGGAGTDNLIVNLLGATAAVTINLSGDINAAMSTLLGSTIVNFERVSQFFATAFDDSFTGSAQIDSFYGGDGADVANGGLSNDLLSGQNGNDALYGEGGNDTLLGGDGSDVLFGGDGNDNLDVYGSGQAVQSPPTVATNEYVDGGIGFDYLNYNRTSFIDGVAVPLITADLIIDLGRTTSQDTGFGLITILNVEGLQGGSGDDLFWGSNVSNQIYGHAGDDLVMGYGGSDVLYGGAGDDILIGGYNQLGTTPSGNPIDTNDTLNGEAGDDTLRGGDGNDVLNGGDGADNLRGDAGNDTLNGGEGLDTAAWRFDVAGLTTGVVLDASAVGTMTNLTIADGLGGTDTLIGIENVIITGSIHADQLSGGTGDDQLWGSGGADTLNGGGGIDTVVYLNAALGVAVNLNNAVQSGGETLISIENIIGSNHTDLLYGNAGANRIAGGDGLDSLRGNAGSDLLFGDGGDDIIYGGYGFLAPPAGQPVDGADEIFGGEGNDTLRGNEGHDLLYGETGDDYLRGDQGDDTLDGGEGFDLVHYTFESATSGVTFIGSGIGGAAVTSQADGVGGTDTLISIEGLQLTGSSFNDTVYGGRGVDFLFGQNGVDTLFGGAGVDELFGGDGNDVLVGNDNPFLAETDLLDGGEGDDILYAEARDVIEGGAGRDSLIAVNSYDFTLDMGAGSIEYAALDYGNDVVTAATQTERVDIFASGGADTVTGSAFDDLIFGGVGDDVIVGGAGADSIVGEAGADSLSGGDGDDRVYFDAQDTLVSGGAGYDAGYILPGTGGGVTLNLGAATLEFIQDFAGGADTLDGSTATAAINVFAGAGGDTVTGSAFNDVVWGEAGDDILSGNAGVDVLVGGAGADRLAGGLGNDALYGGAADGAADAFVFQHSGAANSDAVYDFVVGTDKLDLSALGGSFANVSIVTAGGSSIVYLSGQQICIVVGVTTLSAGDFIMAASGAPDALAGTQPHSLEVIPIDAAPADPFAYEASGGLAGSSWSHGPQDSGWLTVLV